MNRIYYIDNIKRFFSRKISGIITKSNATPAQLELLEFMKYLSEEYMCASWLGHLDHSLHNVLFFGWGADSFAARDPLTKNDFDTLRRLFLNVNGWWRFLTDGPDDFIFLPVGAWFPIGWHPCNGEGRPNPLKYKDLVDSKCRQYNI